MILIRETTCRLPYYAPIPLTPLPLIYQREHLFPYESFGDTAPTPVGREFRMVSIENEFLRVEVAPELGGRVYRLFDQRLGKEITFCNPVVKPVRILPIWAFISGGIEFNFPIAHSPTSITEVGCATGRAGNYGFIRIGEREARTGMEWVVELGLAEGSGALVQRTAFRNETSAAHPWMSWTIAAVPSTEQTEFIHPPHRVLVHDHRVAEADWPGDGLNWNRHVRNMTAFFWKPGSAPAFGAYHHHLGHGLMHLADPAHVPGKKVWTYGFGRHRDWSLATTEGDLAYAEIESGPLLDQSEKPLLQAGAERRFEEYWIPVGARAACDEFEFPELELPPMVDPWLGWKHSKWQSEWEQFRRGEAPLPASTVPTGIDLEAALRRELARGNAAAAEPLALWLAFWNRPREALPLVEHSAQPTARRLAGLILWKALERATDAAPYLEAGPLNDPIAAVELDELYAQLERTAERVTLLARAPAHRYITERRADLALSLNQPAEVIRILGETTWPREHQRYVRTELWRKAKAALGEADAAVPDFLREDNLARFGAYWSD